MKQKTKTTAVQLVKYGLVGVSNSLITLAVIFVCNELLGLKLMLADVIGYIAGVINSFICNKNWVFKSHNHRLRYEMSLFLIGFLLCFGKLRRLAKLEYTPETRHEVMPLFGSLIPFLNIGYALGILLHGLL